MSISDPNAETTVSFLKGNNPTIALPEDFIRFNTQSSQSATASESLESWKVGLSFVYISITQAVVNLPFPTWTYLMACQLAAAPLKASSKRKAVFHILGVVSISKKKGNLIFKSLFVAAKYRTSALWYSSWGISMWIIPQLWEVMEILQISILKERSPWPGVSSLHRVESEIY